MYVAEVDGIELAAVDGGGVLHRLEAPMGVAWFCTLGHPKHPKTQVSQGNQEVGSTSELG